jgi:septum formation inhibitor-activating ATPase MinD
VFKGIFRKWRVEWRKHNIYNRYKKVMTNAHKSILNIEELATIYHFPMTAVVAPRLERIESKKGGPPMGLPILEE